MDHLRDAQDFLDSLKPSKETRKEGDIPENDTILIQGIPISVSELDLEDELIHTKAAFESLKFIRDRQGIPKGFAFVKFFSKELARKWFQRNDGFVLLQHTKCPYTYSFHQDKEDWECGHCGGMNFKRRAACYRCGIPRAIQQDLEVMVNVGSMDAGTVPSRFLLVRGFPVDSTPKDVFELPHLECKRFHLVRKRDSVQSLRFGFAEFANERLAEDALKNLLCEKSGSKPMISGQMLTITFAHLGSFLTVPDGSLYISLSETLNEQTAYKRYWDESCFTDPFPPLDFVVRTQFVEKTISHKKESKIKNSTQSLKMSLQFQKWQDTQKHYNISGISIPILFEKVPKVREVNRDHSDFQRIGCLLCKRKFQDMASLERHFDLSPRHAQMVTFFRKQKLNRLIELESKIAEEKALYEEQQVQHTFQPTRYGIRKDNVGNQMLRKMGWKAGQGLGVDGKGITKAVKLQRVRKGAGIGSSSGKRRG
jgi:predicted GIY-YIG superfamily endonuclease